MRQAAHIALAVLALAGLPGVGWGVTRQEGAVAGRVHALAVFARFEGEETGGNAAPEFASRIFAADFPGSLTHYYTEMSRGQLLLTGQCQPAWYTASGPASDYMAPEGRYGAFVREVLAQVDRDVDLARYDDDGPDGVPDSGDDDGYVDFLFVVTRTAPPNFIVDEATGVAALGLAQDYIAEDRTHQGARVRIRADEHVAGPGGALQQGHAFEVAVGSMAHEFGHYLGLVDLYDLRWDDGGTGEPARDSAGIGYWGLMGHGNRGWDERGGPNPLCAFDLQQLGWLGAGNAQLRVLDANRDGVVFADVNAGGVVYRLPLEGAHEYLLVEHRARGTSFYERHLPAEGLLIWHVHEGRATNDDEAAKRVDLVCADGLYLDAGYPLGRLASPSQGGDNLDFWAHDAAYARAHAGNLGDATDVFDGVRYTGFWAVSNPRGPAGVSVNNIHREGAAMVADLKLDDRRRAGPIVGSAVWSDTVEVLGDVYVGPEAWLRVDAGTVVRVGPDQLAQGEDTSRVELIVDGELSVNVADGAPVRFASAASRPEPGDWVGIRARQLSQLVVLGTTFEHAVTALTVEHSQSTTLREIGVYRTASHGLDLRTDTGWLALTDVQVSQAGGAGLRIAGDGHAAVRGAHLSDNAGPGLERIGGLLELWDSRLAGNGGDSDTSANLVLGSQTQGTIHDNVFAGGVGIQCSGSGGVLITQNRIVGSRVGLVSLTARPRITANVFEDNALAFRIAGFAVPARLDLNVVQNAQRLVENTGELTLTATNNWWGRDDAEWIAARISGPVEWEPFLNFDPRVQVDFALTQNYPNPFNGSTVIRYTVGAGEAIVTGQARMVLEVRSVVGGLVRRLVDEPAAPGLYQATWDGRDDSGGLVASGVYYYQLRVGPLLELRRLVYLK
ncbi:MAG: immune inhibitor A domain-containing protein [Candidatus Latescibacterota bacterium]